MYKRITVYPTGAPIPESLPDSYQPASYGNAPTGQSCINCKHFSLTTRFCSLWKATVKPRWWCDDWASMMKVGQSSVASSMLLKKITTSTVEEHFSQLPNLNSKLKDYEDEFENEEDVIKVNVPLMIRLLEWAREDAGKDVELHTVTERLIELSEEGDTLTMSDYSEIIQDTEVEKKEN